MDSGHSKASTELRQDSGFDSLYQSRECAWGINPDRIMADVKDLLPLPGAVILDAGCGEGRNAFYLASQGAVVHATDVSPAALDNARGMGAGTAGVHFFQGDIMTDPLPGTAYDGVIACCLLQWLPDEAAVERVLGKLQSAVCPGGLLAVVAFNSRLPYSGSGPGFGTGRGPTLLPHEWYMKRHSGWRMIVAADTDSTHTHPGQRTPHSHAISRIIALRPHD